MGLKTRGVKDIKGPLRIVNKTGMTQDTKVYVGDLDITNALGVFKIITEIDAEVGSCKSKLILSCIHTDILVQDIKTLFVKPHNFCGRCGTETSSRFCERCGTNNGQTRRIIT